MAARTPHLQLAEGLARQGHAQPAVDACYQALAVDESEPLVHCLLAQVMLSESFHDEAIEAATRAIELDPSCSPAYLALGLAYDRRGGMWDRSVLVWHELAEVVPDLPLAHVQLGEAFAAANFEEEAIEAWKAALAVDPREPRAMYDLSIAALKAEGILTALPGFRKAGELDATQDELFFELAGLAPDAVPPSDVAAVPPDREARLAAAAAFASAEDLFAAAALCRAVLDENPQDARALALAAYTYLRQEAVNEAVACALRALTIDGSDRTALYCLGICYARRPGLARHATRVFAALAKAAPGHAMPFVLLAESLLGSQRFARAKEAYRRAVRIDPGCVRARYGLAAVYLSEGAYAEAEWEVRRAAYHDVRRRKPFWALYDAYLREVSERG